MTRPNSFVSPQELAGHYRELRHSADTAEARWFLLIKELRAEHGFGILQAERMALRDPTLRKWAERQINTQPRCRKLALSHMRANGETSLIERAGDGFRIRVPE